MKQLSLEAKEAIVKQALERTGRSYAEIATMNNIGYSTLQKWLRAKREGKPLVTRVDTSKKQQVGKLSHLLATTNLDETAIGVYCREHGIYSHQLSQWRNELMSDTNNKSEDKRRGELRALKAENKQLKQDLRRKEKALAEASALLILKKKADLIWGDAEDD